MIKLYAAFILFSLAVNLQAPVLSQAATHQSKNHQRNRKQSIRNNSEESAKSIEFDCLPEGFKSTDIASYRQKQKGGVEHVTIKDKLIELKARCKEGKLVDEKGREIRFFKFACYGNPPSDYEEIAQKEREALEKLQRDYTVIIIECDPHMN